MFVVSGADGSLGTDTKRGAEIAQSDRPTVAGHTVELIGEDEGCNAEGGQAAGTKVASNSKVVAAIGTNCSSAARAAIPLLFAAGIPMVSPSNTAPDLTAADRPAEYAFYMRTAHNDTIQGAAMAKFAIEKGYKNAATIHDGSLYADKLQQVFADEFKELGGTIVAQEATDPTETNMGPMLTRIAAANPDFIYLPIFIAAGGQIASQAKQNADLADVQLAGADGIFSPDFLAGGRRRVPGLPLVQPRLLGLRRRLPGLPGQAPGEVRRGAAGPLPRSLLRRLQPGCRRHRKGRRQVLQRLDSDPPHGAARCHAGHLRAARADRQPDLHRHRRLRRSQDRRLRGHERGCGHLEPRRCRGQQPQEDLARQLTAID